MILLKNIFNLMLFHERKILLINKYYFIYLLKNFSSNTEFILIEKSK